MGAYLVMSLHEKTFKVKSVSFKKKKKQKNPQTTVSRKKSSSTCILQGWSPLLVLHYQGQSRYEDGWYFRPESI